MIPGVDRVQRFALIAGIGGLALCVMGLFFDAKQVLESYLYGFVFWVGIGIGCLGLLFLQHIVKGNWGIAIRRLLEAGALTVPLMAALFIPVLVGLQNLYPWTSAELIASNPALQQKSMYLNVPFFIVRAVAYFGLWSGLAYTLNRWSRRADTTDDPEIIQRMKSMSIFGAVVLTITLTFAMIDWVMSLEPQWSSTIYGVMVGMGSLLAALALVVTLLTRLRHDSSLNSFVTPAVLGDLGNLLLAGLMMWAYLSFSQYLVIWMGNLSEEIPWYLRRLDGGWQIVALLIIGLHFLIPFVLLLSQQVKRSARLLGAVTGLLFVMHLVDVFWLVVPGLRQIGFTLRWTDFTALIGIGGLWISVFLWRLNQSSLLPRFIAQDAGHSQEANING